jgi:ribosome-binding factor A
MYITLSSLSRLCEADVSEPKRRNLQIASTVREELVSILRKDLSDPDVEKVGFITLSGVDLSEDVRNATVWVAFMGKQENDKQVQAALAALNRSAKFIHRLLIKRISMKVHPVPAFKFDRGFDRAAAVGKALHDAAQVEEETRRHRAEQEPGDEKGKE